MTEDIIRIIVATLIVGVGTNLLIAFFLWQIVNEMKYGNRQVLWRIMNAIQSLDPDWNVWKVQLQPEAKPSEEATQAEN